MGGVFHLVGRLIYLILIFPVAMGLTAGGLTFAANYAGKIRNTTVTLAFGLLSGLCLYGGMHGADYLQFRGDVAASLSEELDLAEGADADTDALIDLYLQDQVGESGFLGYLKYSAEQGVSIGRVGRGGVNLGATGTWIYWLVELLVIEIIAGGLAFGVADSSVFCEECDRWYDAKKPVGSVSPENADAFLEALNHQNYNQAGTLIGPVLEKTENSLKISQESCSPCDSEVDVLVTVERQAINHRRDSSYFSRVQRGLLTAREYRQLQPSSPGQASAEGDA